MASSPAADSSLGPVEEERPAFWRFALPAALVCPWLLSLAFPKSNVAWLALIALAPLFLLWSRASWKQAFWSGWLAGTITFALLFRWMMTSLGDFIGNFSWLALGVMSVIEGLSLAGVALATALACRGRFRSVAIFAAPAAWLLIEMFRTRGSLGVPFGELGQVGPHLTWLLPFASIGGVFGLTAVIGLCNGAVAAIAGGTPAARRTGGITLAVLALLIVATDVANSRVVVPPPNLTVAIAQGNIQQGVKWSPAVFAQTMSAYAALTREASKRGAKIVVWPETAITSFPLQHPALLASLQSLAQNAHLWIIAGTLDRPTAAGYYNSLIDLSPQGTVAGVYYKRWLVPFAEYLPLDRYLRPLPLFNDASQFLRGPGPHLLPAAGLQWGSLVCYESAYANYARATANAGADALIVATDDAWFGTSSGPYEHADAARIDAVQTGRWVVRAADTGISQFIDPKGKVVAELPLDVRGLLVGQIGPGFVTVYDRFGALWIVVLALVALLLAMLPERSPDAGWRSRRGAW